MLLILASLAYTAAQDYTLVSGDAQLTHGEVVEGGSTNFRIAVDSPGACPDIKRLEVGLSSQSIANGAYFQASDGTYSDDSSKGFQSYGGNVAKLNLGFTLRAPYKRHGIDELELTAKEYCGGQVKASYPFRVAMNLIYNPLLYTPYASQASATLYPSEIQPAVFNDVELAISWPGECKVVPQIRLTVDMHRELVGLLPADTAGFSSRVQGNHRDFNGEKGAIRGHESLVYSVSDKPVSLRFKLITNSLLAQKSSIQVDFLCDWVLLETKVVDFRGKGPSSAPANVTANHATSLRMAIAWPLACPVGMKENVKVLDTSRSLFPEWIPQYTVFGLDEASQKATSANPIQETNPTKFTGLLFENHWSSSTRQSKLQFGYLAPSPGSALALELWCDEFVVARFSQPLPIAPRGRPCRRNRRS